MKQKIIHILGDLAIGGAEMLVLDMIRCGASSNIEYHVVYMRAVSADMEDKFREAGAILTQIECGKGLKLTGSFIKGLRTYLIENKINTIHCHNNINAYWAYFASLNLDCEIILSIHGCNLNLNYLRDKFKLKKLFSPDRYIINKCSLVFVSNSAKEHYCTKYPGRTDIAKGTVIYNGIDTAKITSATPITISQTGNKPLFAMVGSFNSFSNEFARIQIVICKAIALLKTQYNGELPFQFIFIGASNSKWDTLPDNNAVDIKNDMYVQCKIYCKENNLEEDILFLPPRGDIPAVLRSIQCYVYASQNDTFGLSVIEAIISGLPVICSNIQTFQEVTLNGKLATLVPNTQEAFANAISAFIERGEEFSTTLPKTQRIQTAIAKYSIEECVKNYFSGI